MRLEKILGIIAIAWGDVLWMNRNLRFLAGPRLNFFFFKSTAGQEVELSVDDFAQFFHEKKYF